MSRVDVSLLFCVLGGFLSGGGSGVVSGVVDSQTPRLLPGEISALC